MISIVIPVYGNQEITDNCIESIRNSTPEGSYEIIVIDNGSNPKFSTEYLTGLNCVVLVNETNLGFPAAINQGILASSGDIIILLNNDCIVTPGSLNRLDTWLNNYSIVGPLTNFCAGLQASVSIPIYNTVEELNKNASYLSKSNCGESLEVNYVIGFCMAFKRSLYDEIGPFDESLWPCSGEEVDFCYRAKQKGYNIGIAKDIYVHHHGSQTFLDMQNKGQLNYQDVCNKTDNHLESRWGKGVFVQEIIKEESKDVNAVRLNLGCGYRKLDGYINIDNRKEIEPDACVDIICGLPYSDSSIDEIIASDFLEHIPIGKVIFVMEEIWRVLKPNGIFESLTPSTDGRGAFQDPTHVSFWNKNSWLYYSNKEYRDLYNIKANFDIIKLEDMVTNQSIKIIHTHVIAKATKED